MIYWEGKVEERLMIKRYIYNGIFAAFAHISLPWIPFRFSGYLATFVKILVLLRVQRGVDLGAWNTPGFHCKKVRILT